MLEDGVISIVLAAMVLLPVVEIILRAVFHSGIYGASALEQHLALVVAMLGAVIAARHKRLLAISLLPELLQGRVKALPQFVAGMIGVTVCLLLSWASMQFVMAVYEPARMVTRVIPVWLMQLSMPIGFALIAWRILLHSTAGTWTRLGIICVAIITCTFIATHPTPPVHAMPVALSILVAGTVVGMPLFAVLAGLAIILFWTQDIPLASIAVDQFRMVTNPT